VNGAGGDGGSLTLLCPAGAGARRALVEAVGTAPGATVLPVRVSRGGLRRREL
jgi:hypothetical protein